MAQRDLLRRYLDAGVAFTAMTKSRAEDIAKELLKAGEIQRDQVQSQVDEIIERSRRNSDHLVALVRKEVTAQLTDLASTLRDEIRSLERRLGGAAATIKPSPTPTSAATPADVTVPTKKPSSRRAPTKKAAPAPGGAADSDDVTAPAKKAPSKRAPAKKAAPTTASETAAAATPADVTAPTKKASSKRAPAEKAVPTPETATSDDTDAITAPGKKASAKRTPAKKAVPASVAQAATARVAEKAPSKRAPAKRATPAEEVAAATTDEAPAETAPDSRPALS
jgi:polyhydroxyalkanoate synthesis regulator phasin